MRRRTIALAIVLGLSGTGCATITDSAHGTAYWTRRAIEDAREHHRNRTLADRAWAAQVTTVCRGATADYADGFKAGFADHLYRGTTQPPPLPPKKYRGLHYQTPDGFRAGSNWLAGFRHGIEDARVSGLRQMITGPSSLQTELAPGMGYPTVDPVELLSPPGLLDGPRLPQQNLIPPAVEESVTTARAAPPGVLPRPVPEQDAPAAAVAIPPFVVRCGFVGPVDRLRPGATKPLPHITPPAGAVLDEVPWVPGGTLRPAGAPVTWAPRPGSDPGVAEKACRPDDEPGVLTAGGPAR